MPLRCGCESQIASPSQAGSGFLRNRSLYREERVAQVNVEMHSNAVTALLVHKQLSYFITNFWMIEERQFPANHSQVLGIF